MAKGQKSSVMTIQQAADALDTTPAKVRRLLRGGQIKGSQENSRWTVNGDSVASYKKNGAATTKASAAPAKGKAKGKAKKAAKPAPADDDEDEEEESDEDDD